MTACQRLDVARPLERRGPGDLPRQHLAFRDAIPAEWGNVISVTSSAAYPNWAQAWFERPDNSIVVVWINSRTGYMLEDALVIPRK
jgi:hypothetical protein